MGREGAQCVFSASQFFRACRPRRRLPAGRGDGRKYGEVHTPLPGGSRRPRPRPPSSRRQDLSNRPLAPRPRPVRRGTRGERRDHARIRSGEEPHSMRPAHACSVAPPPPCACWHGKRGPGGLNPDPPPPNKSGTAANAQRDHRRLLRPSGAEQKDANSPARTQ
jgi:hypothetical protein